MCAIEDAGWDVRDTLMWLHGQGFPKSLDISKAIDKAAGAEREAVAKNPNFRNGRISATSYVRGNASVESPDITAPATDAAKLWHGWGTALKPAFEPICLAMKPLDGTFAENALTHGVAGLAIDRCRIGGEKPLRKNTDGKEGLFGMGSRLATGTTTQGRWPANVLHDGSADVLAGFPEVKAATSRTDTVSKGMFHGGNRGTVYGDTGSAAGSCTARSRRAGGHRNGHHDHARFS